jgi:hypothetical protein
MRSRALTVLMLFMLTCVALSQSSPPGEMLEIKGIKLRLGMDQNAVEQKIREKNLTIATTKSMGDVWLLCDSPEGKECDPVLGEVGFNNGRVTIVTKRWTETNGATELVAALYGAAKDLEAHGFSHCELVNRETVDPGFEVKYVEMKCSEHLSLSVTLMRSQTSPSAMVEEQLILDPKR